MNQRAIQHSSSLISGLQVLRLLPARGFAAVLAVAHGAVSGLVWTLPLHGLLLLALTVVVAVSAIHAIRRHALRQGAHSVVDLEFGNRAHCRVGFSNGNWLQAAVIGTSTVSRWLTVINLEIDLEKKRQSGKSKITRLIHVVIVPGSMDADAYRRSRVWLRFGPQPVKTPPGV